MIDELPDDISKQEYSDVRKSWQDQDGKYPDWYIGAVGFLASYNGKFFGGRAGTVRTKIGTIRNYYDEAKRNLLAQIPNLSGIEFDEFDYQQLDMSKFKGGVIYCDIPYKNTTGYQQTFNHDEFWEWADKEKIISYMFEAFDEPWKGGSKPNEAEKNWGIYKVDRTPKLLLR